MLSYPVRIRQLRNVNTLFVCLFVSAALLQDNVDANQEAFLNHIVQPGGPIEQALNYLNAHESLGQV